jgi:hypothetical protein
MVSRRNRSPFHDFRLHAGAFCQNVNLSPYRGRRSRRASDVAGLPSTKWLRLPSTSVLILPGLSGGACQRTPMPTRRAPPMLRGHLWKSHRWAPVRGGGAGDYAPAVTLGGVGRPIRLGLSPTSPGPLEKMDCTAPRHADCHLCPRHRCTPPDRPESLAHLAFCLLPFAFCLLPPTFDCRCAPQCPTVPSGPTVGLLPRARRTPTGDHSANDSARWRSAPQRQILT